MSKKLNIPVIAAFILLFVYGALLLMIGYTQEGIRNVLGGGDSNMVPSSTMTFLLVGQSLGLILSTIILGKLIKKFNIRYIFVASFSIGLIVTLLIAFFDKYAGGMSVTGRCVLYVFFTLGFGLAIGPTSPLVSTFLSAVYQGHTRTKMLCVSNGIYGIGAGILPLAFASVVNKTSGTTDFNSVRYFYFIAAGLSVLAMFVGFLINYKHTEQQTSSKILDTTNKSFSVWAPLMCVVALMSAYMIAETIVNYTYKSAANQQLSNAVTVTMAFGLFIMVQGLWRAFSGLFLVSKIKPQYFILGSTVVLLAGFIISIVPHGLSTPAGVYIAACLLGLGLGNLWPVIFSYAISIDERRSSFIGIVMNVVSMFWIPVTQVIAACILLGNSQYLHVWILGIVAVAGIFAFAIFAWFFISNFQKKYGNDKVDQVSKLPNTKSESADISK